MQQRFKGLAAAAAVFAVPTTPPFTGKRPFSQGV
jgi:hypothetical protein